MLSKKKKKGGKYLKRLWRINKKELMHVSKDEKRKRRRRVRKENK